MFRPVFFSWWEPQSSLVNPARPTPPPKYTPHATDGMVSAVNADLTFDVSMMGLGEKCHVPASQLKTVGDNEVISSEDEASSASEEEKTSINGSSDICCNVSGTGAAADYTLAEDCSEYDKLGFTYNSTGDRNGLAASVGANEIINDL